MSFLYMDERWDADVQADLCSNKVSMAAGEMFIRRGDTVGRSDHVLGRSDSRRVLHRQCGHGQLRADYSSEPCPAIQPHAGMAV